MEATYSTAGNGYEQTREQGSIGNWVMVGKGLCNTGDIALMCEDTHAYKDGHDKQRSAKDRIDSSNDLINGEYRYSQVKDKNYNCPNQVGISNTKQP
jgi:hypothetical protein